MTLTPHTKEKISIVISVSKRVFQWGFIPAVLYLG
jgi:import receptor subunit TOM7